MSNIGFWIEMLILVGLVYGVLMTIVIGGMNSRVRRRVDRPDTGLADPSPVERSGNAQLAWSVDAAAFRKYRRRIVPEFPRMQILVDKQAGTVTFENCYAEFPPGYLSIAQLKPFPSYTCDLSEIREVYICRQRGGTTTIIMNSTGQARLPECWQMPCQEQLDAVRSYLADISRNRPGLGFARSPGFATLVYMTFSIVAAGLVIWLLMLIF